MCISYQSKGVVRGPLDMSLIWVSYLEVARVGDVCVRGWGGVEVGPRGKRIKGP